MVLILGQILSNNWSLIGPYFSWISKKCQQKIGKNWKTIKIPRIAFGKQDFGVNFKFRLIISRN
jgi:hypothetical protein